MNDASYDCGGVANSVSIVKIRVNPILARSRTWVTPNLIARAELAIHAQSAGPTRKGLMFIRKLSAGWIDDMKVDVFP